MNGLLDRSIRAILIPFRTIFFFFEFFSGYVNIFEVNISFKLLRISSVLQHLKHLDSTAPRMKNEFSLTKAFHSALLVSVFSEATLSCGRLSLSHGASLVPQRNRPVADTERP